MRTRKPDPFLDRRPQERGLAQLLLAIHYFAAEIELWLSDHNARCDGCAQCEAVRGLRYVTSCAESLLRGFAAPSVIRYINYELDMLDEEQTEAFRSEIVQRYAEKHRKNPACDELVEAFRREVRETVGKGATREPVL